MNRIAAFLLIVAFCIPAHAGQCHVLYRQQAVVVNHHAYAQQFVAPIVHYAVGADIQQDAVAEKIAQRVAAKLQAIQPAQSVKQVTASTGMLAAKCARCHQGESAEGGVVLDGSQPIDSETIVVIVDMMVNGKNVPTKMQGVIAGLKGEEKGQIQDDLLSIRHKFKKQPEPEAGVLE